MSILSLQRCLYIIFKGKPADQIDWKEYSLEDTVTVDNITYAFIRRSVKGQEDILYIVWIVEDAKHKTIQSGHIILPTNEYIIPFLKILGKVCQPKDEIDKIMKEMGYNV
jgi:hypothetical protein